MMREFSSNDGEARLDAAIEAFKKMEIPVDPVERIKVRARTLSSVPVEPQVVPPKGQRPYGIVSWVLSLAATLAVAIGALTWLAPPSVASSFARVVQNAKEARSVQGIVKSRFGDSPVVEGKVYLESNKIRQEFMDGALVLILDMQQKKRLYLNRPLKTWQTDNQEDTIPQGLIDPVSQLANAKPAGAKSLGEEMLGKLSTRVYQVSPVKMLGVDGDGVMTVWVDEATGLPAQLVIKDINPQHESEIRFEQLAWNQPQDASLFSLEIPKDYKPGQIMITSRSRMSAPQPTIPKMLDGQLQGLEFHRAVARILWTKPKEVTVLLRDPEKTKPGDYQPFELIHVGLTSGRMYWSHKVAGTGTVVACPSTEKLITIIGREIQIRNASTGNTEATLVNPTRAGTWAISPDGKTLVTGIEDWNRKNGPQGGFRIWDLTKKEIRQSGTDDLPTTYLAFAPDGQSFATSSNSGPVRLWESASGKLVRTVPGVSGVFAPGGEILAVSSADPGRTKEATSLDLYRVSTGEKIRTLTSGKGPSPSTVLGIAFSPDGKRVAAVDWNGEVRVWDVATGQIDPTPRSHKGGVLSVSFSPDGKQIATGSEDGTMRLWTLEK